MLYLQAKRLGGYVAVAISDRVASMGNLREENAEEKKSQEPREPTQ